jgi:predicted membrane protein
MITLAKCLDHQTKKLLLSFTFALSFLFFSLSSFSSQTLDHHSHHTIIMIFTIAPPLGIVLPIS